MRKKIFGILVIVILIVGITAGILLSRNQKTEGLKTIQVNEVTRSVFYVPQYAAIAKGFFEEEGLNIELTTSEGTDKVMTAILANQSDIGFAGPEASLYIYNEGKEDYAQIFAQITKRDGSFLISRQPTDNFNWKDLKGKTVIPGRKGGMPYMTLEYVLRKNGLDPQKDLVLDDSIKFDLMAGAFTGGTADYVTLFEPTASMTQNQQKGYIVASVGEASGEIPYTTYFAKKSYIESNPEIIEKFTRAVYKGQKWVEEHSSDEIAQAVQSYFPSTDVTLLASVVDSYKRIDAWNTTPILTQDSFTRLQDVMEEAGELKQRAPYELIVNNSFGEKVISE